MRRSRLFPTVPLLAALIVCLAAAGCRNHSAAALDVDRAALLQSKIAAKMVEIGRQAEKKRSDEQPSSAIRDTTVYLAEAGDEEALDRLVPRPPSEDTENNWSALTWLAANHPAVAGKAVRRMGARGYANSTEGYYAQIVAAALGLEAAPPWVDYPTSTWQIVAHARTLGKDAAPMLLEWSARGEAGMSAAALCCDLLVEPEAARSRAEARLASLGPSLARAILLRTLLGTLPRGEAMKLARKEMKENKDQLAALYLLGSPLDRKAALEALSEGFQLPTGGSFGEWGSLTSLRYSTAEAAELSRFLDKQPPWESKDLISYNVAARLLPEVAASAPDNVRQIAPSLKRLLGHLETFAPGKESSLVKEAGQSSFDVLSSQILGTRVRIEATLFLIGEIPVLPDQWPAYGWTDEHLGIIAGSLRQVDEGLRAKRTEPIRDWDALLRALNEMEMWELSRGYMEEGYGGEAEPPTGE
jgi:hypothetical protein